MSCMYRWEVKPAIGTQIASGIVVNCERIQVDAGWNITIRATSKPNGKFGIKPLTALITLNQRTP